MTVHSFLKTHPEEAILYLRQEARAAIREEIVEVATYARVQQLLVEVSAELEKLKVAADASPKRSEVRDRRDQMRMLQAVLSELSEPTLTYLPAIWEAMNKKLEPSIGGDVEA
jgi:hypothetical protein